MRTLVQVSHRLVAGAVAIAIAIILSTPPGIAQTPTPGPREMPARTIPVPDTVSPQMQKIIAAPLTPTWNVIPNTPEEWKAQVNAVTVAAMQGLPGLQEALHVKIEPMTIDGVKAFMGFHRITSRRRTRPGCSFMNAPETREAFEEIASFFDRHLGK